MDLIASVETHLSWCSPQTISSIRRVSGGPLDPAIVNARKCILKSIRYDNNLKSISLAGLQVMVPNIIPSLDNRHLGFESSWRWEIFSGNFVIQH